LKQTVKRTLRHASQPKFRNYCLARQPGATETGWLIGQIPSGRAKMPYDGIGAEMSTRELIARELDHMPEQDLDKLLAFLRSLKGVHAETAMPMLAAESSLAKDWLTPEEDAAWANL